MSISSFLKNLQERVFLCIETHLQTNLNIRNVTISYIGDLSFYHAIETNFPGATETLILLYSENDQGIYKHNEHVVLIKTSEMFNPDVLMVELLHSRAVFQGKKYIQDWIKEGVPHYLAYMLCRICGFEYQLSLSEINYFNFWHKIYRTHYEQGLSLLESILYPTIFYQSIITMKNVLHYPKDDVLELEFEEAQRQLNSLGY